MNTRLSEGFSEGPWRRWASASDIGAALHAVGSVLANNERNAEAHGVFLSAEDAGADCDLALGDSFVIRGDWAAALPRLRRVVGARSSQWEVAAFRLAQHAREVENRTDDEVVELASVAFEEVPFAVVFVGDLLRRRGETDRARALLESHLDTNDHVPFELGVHLYEVFGDVDGAKAAFLQAYERGDFRGAYNLGCLASDVDDDQIEAVEWFRRAADAGDSMARVELVRRGAAAREDDVDGQPAWVTSFYPVDLAPWILAESEPDSSRPPLFVVDDDKPFPTAGQLGAAGRAKLRIHLHPTKRGLDLTTFAAAIPDLQDLTIEKGARITGLAALLEARSLTDLNVRILGKEPLDLSALPSLRSASVTGANVLSVCRNPHVEWLGLGLPRASQLPVIEAPVRTLIMTAKHSAAVLERMVQPHLLESLTLYSARDLDLDVLRRFANLRKLELNWCNGVVNAAALADLTELRELELYRCRNVDDVRAVKAAQSRTSGGDDGGTVAGPFLLFEYGEDDEGLFDLSTGDGGWEGLAEGFADRVLSYNGYDMEKLVVAIAKDAGLWSRDVERDSEAEALHLIFRGRESPVAIAKAAWRILQDAEQLEKALRAARLVRK
ncbi:hypothetical protein ELQ94_07070 [Labedella endophytica]|uniref:Sel1 repeat family protein n=1 Tax=Labedella endophytica TaxID=1523160 RepID=A0A3S0VTT9_9MICO|nr:hypothetical protein ELQ94_07070 [Labedella endophytica]